MSSKIKKLLIWVITGWVIFSGIWGIYFSRPFPIPGLTDFSSLDPVIKWSVIVGVVSVATGLTLESWKTRDRLLVFQGIVITLGFIVLFFIDMTVGLAFLVFYKIVTNKISEL